ncbi:WYL domain-containing protein [Ohessyouella blattaphilus]|uniref:WYL domain-containing protein n=1 Tax=Ohessyouella blattaphilus TaxID=2949333 RepID=A0ABT1EM99_9FIRM|nr:WYL domain-containing protein [Ohessyouella blattaphilus]MCP1110922.1 WYL domain-containing protein [Ohessyouella blattaphilus]MCR8564316.1 WYL domain-containing protein [Ohessyouella blattaphilus]
MSDLEKINIYIPKNIVQVIDSDATMFEIYKKDGKTINKNRFLSLLLIGYYEVYASKLKKTYDAIIKEIDTAPYEETIIVADSIVRKVFLPEVPSRKGKNFISRALKPTKETENIVRNIKMEVGPQDSLSGYLCRMIMSYCEMPFSERERVIFKMNYDRLSAACQRKEAVSFSTIWNKEKIYDVKPYKVVVGQEELFNYLICMVLNKATGIQESRSFRLNRICGVNYGKTKEEISDKIKNFLDKMMKYGPQYSINDNEKTYVKLTEDGKRSYNRIYYGRPQYEEIIEKSDGSYYCFSCSKDQIFLYFRRFVGNEAEIIAPQSQRIRMKEFHKKSLEVYEKLNEEDADE